MNKRIENIDVKQVDDSNFNLYKNNEIPLDRKSARGIVQIKKNNEIIETTQNLVLLSGREFLAQKLADVNSSIITKELALEQIMKNFQIRYFGVGMGGATQTTIASKVGPYLNDLDLNIGVQIFGSNSSNNNYEYIHNGKMKRILKDGSIEILGEEHLLSIDGNIFPMEANTTIKFTLHISENEMVQKPFCFNEAALYAVDMDSENDVPRGVTSSDKFDAGYITFARFTTLNKYIEENDSLTIEWYILV